MLGALSTVIALVAACGIDFHGVEEDDAFRNPDAPTLSEIGSPLDGFVPDGEGEDVGDDAPSVIDGGSDAPPGIDAPIDTGPPDTGPPDTYVPPVCTAPLVNNAGTCSCPLDGGPMGERLFCKGSNQCQQRSQSCADGDRRCLQCIGGDITKWVGEYVPAAAVTNGAFTCPAHPTTECPCVNATDCPTRDSVCVNSACRTCGELGSQGKACAFGTNLCTRGLNDGGSLTCN